MNQINEPLRLSDFISIVVRTISEAEEDLERLKADRGIDEIDIKSFKVHARVVPLPKYSHSELQEKPASTDNWGIFVNGSQQNENSRYVELLMTIKRNSKH